MAKEKKLQTKILRDLESYGKYCECFKLIKANKNGEPDVFFTMSLTGAVLLELKDDDDPRANQESKIRKINSCGSKAFVCRCWEDWIEVKRFLSINKYNVKEAHNIANQQK